GVTSERVAVKQARRPKKGCFVRASVPLQYITAMGSRVMVIDRIAQNSKEGVNPGVKQNRLVNLHQRSGEKAMEGSVGWRHRDRRRSRMAAYLIAGFIGARVLIWIGRMISQGEGAKHATMRSEVYDRFLRRMV